jgi:hypothetical protein
MKITFFEQFPNKNHRAWSLNILPLIQISHFKHESIEFAFGWLFWECEIRFILKEKKNEKQ